MVIVIDGYNLLKQLFPGRLKSLEKNREHFIKQLSYYRSKKRQDIIVVFDGGEFGYATREVRSGVVVIFSGQKVSADEWILNYVACNKDKELLLVSIDRELINQCQSYNCDAINVFDFYQLLSNTILGDVENKCKNRTFNFKVCKYEHNDAKVQTIESEALDTLMSQAKVDGYEKEDSYPNNKKEIKKKITSSKDEKRVLKKIKKL